MLKPLTIAMSNSITTIQIGTGFLLRIIIVNDNISADTIMIPKIESEKNFAITIAGSRNGSELCVSNQSTL